MTTTTTPIKKEQTNGSSTENHKGIENHRKAAKHHEEAAKHHHDAAKHHEAGNHDKACDSTLKAQGHHCCASELQRENVKQHALRD